MRVHMATDHAGLELSLHLVERLLFLGYEVFDHGPKSYDPEDDYPGFCISAAEAVVADEKVGLLSFGVVLGGSGNGEQIAANKVVGVRAALVWEENVAVLARKHNNANVIALGSRQHSFAVATRFVEVFLQTPFSFEQRHVRRIAKIAEFEQNRFLA